jgi:hypothetical protein
MRGDCIRRVLDWQLDLLDPKQLHTITVYTLYNSLQLSLFCSSEDCCSNSYGVPCHYSLTGAAPLLSTPLFNYLLTPARWPPTSGYIDRKQTTKKTPLQFPYCWNDVVGNPLQRNNMRIVGSRVFFGVRPQAITGKARQDIYSLQQCFPTFWSSRHRWE